MIKVEGGITAGVTLLVQILIGARRRAGLGGGPEKGSYR